MSIEDETSSQRCPACGAYVRPEANNCPQCGASMSIDTEAQNRRIRDFFEKEKKQGQEKDGEPWPDAAHFEDPNIRDR